MPLTPERFLIIIVLLRELIGNEYEMLCNNASRYNQQTIDFLENIALHVRIMADVRRGYSHRAVVRRNGINARQLKLLLKYLEKDRALSNQ